MHTTCIPYLLLIVVHKIIVGPKCQSFCHFNTIILLYVYLATKSICIQFE